MFFFGYIRNLFYSLIHVFDGKKKIESDIEVVVEPRDNRTIDEKMNDWKVDMYAKNVFLYNIPEYRIADQRQKFLEEV